MSDTEHGDGEPEAKSVPYDRFQKVVSERNEHKARVAALEAQVGTLSESAAAVDGLRAQLAEWERKHADAASGWAAERDLMRAGLVDDEAQAVARALYDRLPADGKPETIGAWVTGLKGEGATVPPALAAYLAPPKATATPARGFSPPPVGAGTQPPGAAAPVDAAQLKAAREKWQRGQMSTEDFARLTRAGLGRA